MFDWEMSSVFWDACLVLIPVGAAPLLYAFILDFITEHWHHWH